MAMLDPLLRSALEPFVPDACAACGLPGSSLCERCSDQLVRVGPPLCDRCGHPWPVRVSSCRACVAGIRGCRAALVYDDRARLLLSALKDHRRARVAPALSELLVAHVAPPRAAVLVPVPLGRARRADRGFNQSELIARELGEAWERPVRSLLRRARNGPAQRGLRRPARRYAQRGAFQAVEGRPPASACVVDDVHTTGATLSACASALRAMGVRSVCAVTIARVPLS